MQKIITYSFRAVLTVLSFITVVCAIMHSLFFGFTLVSLFMLAVSLPFLLAGVFYEQTKLLLTFKKAEKTVCKLLKLAAISFFALCFILFFVFASAMLICAEADVPPPDADTVIILGCKVEENGTPSLMLKNRLDTAAEYLLANPDALAVVSGGTGDTADISEAAAMQRYLTQKGVSAERILLEAHSSNTRENLAFSAELLSSQGISSNAKTVIVTDGFHQLRARIWAKNAGFCDIDALSSSTPLYLFPYYFFREFMGITRYVLAGF